jgi:hypothetical protein
MRSIVILIFISLTLTAFGGKKPKTIDEAIAYFENKWNDKEKDAYRTTPEQKAVSDMHFSVGIWIRNEWIRNVKDTSLLNQFHSLGIDHPNDMSGIILTSLHRKLNNLPIDLEAQVTYYKDYWKPFKACDQKAEAMAVETYKKFNTGDSITIFLKVDEQFETRNARKVECPDTEWSFNYKKDLIVKGIVTDKYYLNNESNVFLKVRITYMNFENTPIFFKSARPSDVYDFALKHLLVKH